jgi:hypothetical protein
LTKTNFGCIILKIKEFKINMSETIFDHNEGLTNFDFRIKCNLVLIWSAITSTIWNTPGLILSTLTGQKSQSQDGSNPNSISSAFSNLFGGSENSGSKGSPKSKSVSSNLSQQETTRRQMMQMSKTQAAQIGGNNSPMAQGNQAAQQAIRERIERERRQALVKSSNSGKPSQL